MRTLEPDLFSVGEYWAPEDRPIMQKFLEAMGGRTALFDVCMGRIMSEKARTAATKMYGWTNANTSTNCLWQGKN
jgi:hypothetical protein